MAALAEGRDLIKIDAEGIEAALLAEIRPLLLRDRPSLLIEVLPDAVKLAEFLAALAREAGYGLHVLPEYGSDEIVQVDPATFTADVPFRFHWKDVLLTARPF